MAGQKATDRQKAISSHGQGQYTYKCCRGTNRSDETHRTAPQPNLVMSMWLTVRGVGLEEGCEHQGLHSHELDEDVQGRPGGVLERVSHSVTNDGGLVCVRALAAQGAGVLCGLSLHDTTAFPSVMDLLSVVVLSHDGQF